jgi:hypothetical protein
MGLVAVRAAAGLLIGGGCSLSRVRKARSDPIRAVLGGFRGGLSPLGDGKWGSSLTDVPISADELFALFVSNSGPVVARVVKLLLFTFYRDRLFKKGRGASTWRRRITCVYGTLSVVSGKRAGEAKAFRQQVNKGNEERYRSGGMLVVK